jgi:hypothetical protein
MATNRMWWMAMTMVVATGCTLPTAPTGQNGPSSQQNNPDGGPSPNHPQGLNAKGSVPADLVGQWSYATSSTGIMYQFNADGSYLYVGTMDNDLTCQKIGVSEEGAATFAAATVTLDMTTGNNTTTSCSGDKKTTPLSAKVATKSWRLEGNTIFLWDAGCDGSETCAEQYQKVVQ